jgi:hypothetical protein
MIDNRLRSDPSGPDTVSVGNPDRHATWLLLLYTALSVTVPLYDSTGIEKPSSLCNNLHPTNPKLLLR